MSAPGGQGILLCSLLYPQGLEHSVNLYFMKKVVKMWCISKKCYSVISLTFSIVTTEPCRAWERCRIQRMSFRYLSKLWLSLFPRDEDYKKNPVNSLVESYILMKKIWVIVTGSKLENVYSECSRNGLQDFPFWNIKVTIKDVNLSFIVMRKIFQNVFCLRYHI